jgi:hypothetical protein
MHTMGLHERNTHVWIECGWVTAYSLKSKESAVTEIINDRSYCSTSLSDEDSSVTVSAYKWLLTLNPIDNYQTKPDIL